MSRGKDDFGDRMKMYEMAEAGRHFTPLLPIVARLDGCNFSSFTQGFARPYDKRMTDIMVATTKYLVETTQAKCGFTQSDEISLVFYSDSFKSQIFLDGRIHKMISRLAGRASSYFTRVLPIYLEERSESIIEFDCRCWQLPNLVEATNAILWRELDATKNSVSMLAQHYFSHKQLQNLGRADMMDLLMSLDPPVNWNDCPAFFKRGTYVQRKKISRKFTAEEIDRLPEKHEARTNQDLEIVRSEVMAVVDMPPLSRVTNRVDVIIYGADPTIITDQEEA
jgi:tRNA(His) guanylyltransferase